MVILVTFRCFAQFPGKQQQADSGYEKTQCEDH